jgi:ketosteroid isomerase-like protein
MSAERVQAVRNVYERWGKGDFRASLELFDPLVLFVLPDGFPEAGTYLGIVVEFRYHQVWSFRGPKVIRLENFLERDGALAAAGMV